MRMSRNSTPLLPWAPTRAAFASLMMVTTHPNHTLRRPARSTSPTPPSPSPLPYAPPHPTLTPAHHPTPPSSPSLPYAHHLTLTPARPSPPQVVYKRNSGGYGVLLPQNRD